MLDRIRTNPVLLCTRGDASCREEPQTWIAPRKSSYIGFTAKQTSANSAWRCDLGDSYAFHFTGTIVFPADHPTNWINGPRGMVGVMEFDQKGGVSGTACRNFSGTTGTGTWEGIYSVDSNGIVTMEIAASMGSIPITYELVGVLADNGKRIEVTLTRFDGIGLPEGNIGMVSTGTMTRQ